MSKSVICPTCSTKHSVIPTQESLLAGSSEFKCSNCYTECIVDIDLDVSFYTRKKADVANWGQSEFITRAV